MTHSHAEKLPNGHSARPDLVSYDTGFEHSLEHWMETRRLVREADDEPAMTAKPVHSHGILSVA